MLSDSFFFKLIFVVFSLKCAQKTGLFGLSFTSNFFPDVKVHSDSK